MQLGQQQDIIQGRWEVCGNREKLSNLPKVIPLIPSISFQSPHSQLLFSSAVCSGRRDEICHCQ